MAAGGLSALEPIDWTAPWLVDWAPLGQVLASSGASCVAQALNHAPLHQTGPLAVEFVSQQNLPGGQAYEAFIRGQGKVPTRDNVHDFFNGLAWLHAPRIKAKLNRLQADEIAQAGVNATRGPVRDAVTVLDENGAFLCAPDPVWAALRAMDWQSLFVTLRPMWRECRLWLFGHALLEKLVNPRKPIVAHVCDMPLPPSCLQTAGWGAVDPLIENLLDATFLSSKPFCPLPVLGIPGWWPDNERADFYADPQVFRSPGQRRSSASIKAF